MVFNPCDVTEALRCNPSPDDELFKTLVLRALNGIIIGGAMEAFKTINAPAGTDPVSGVAGVLNITVDSNVTAVGDATTDTLLFGLGFSANNVFLMSRDALDTQNIGVLKVDASDNTVLNSQGATSILFQEFGDTQWEINPDGDFVGDAVHGRNVVFTKLGTGVVNTVAAAVSAAGTVITDATDLTAIMNNITVVAVGSGVQLPVVAIGVTVFVKNTGANALLVYPSSGADSINLAAGGASVSLAAGSTGVFTRITATDTMAFEAPVI